MRTALRCLTACVLSLLAATVAAQDGTPPPTQPPAQQPQTPPAQPPPATPATPAAVPDPDLASPWLAMRTYLVSMKKFKEAYADDNIFAKFSIDYSGPNLTEAYTTFDFEGAAIREPLVKHSRATAMLEVLDRINEVDPSHFLSFRDDPETRTFTYFPQTQGFPLDMRRRHRDVLEETGTEQTIVFVKDAAGNWRFSAETIQNLPKLLEDVEELPKRFGLGGGPLTVAQVIAATVPRPLRDAPLVGVAYWQWLGLLAIIFVGVLLDFAVRTALRGVYRVLEPARRKTTRTDTDLLKRSLRPFGLLAGATFWYWSLRLLGLPDSALEVLLVATRVILALASVSAAFRLTDLLADVLIRQARKTSSRLDNLLIPLLRKTAKVFVAAVAIIYIADSFNFEILPLLTGLGIGGLAFAFAAKDTIENFFGSVAVILDHPFEVGDWVDMAGVEGTVESIGLRSTRIRTFYNSLVTVPNASLVRANVDNYGRRRYRRYKTTVSLTYDSHPERLETFCEAIREVVRLHPYTRKDVYHVWVNELGAHSIDVLVYLFFETPDWGTELRERHRFILEVIRLADRCGVEFAFPTQRVELTNIDDRDARVPFEIPGRNTEKAARRVGVDIAREVTARAKWNEVKPPPVTFAGSGLEAFIAREGPLEDLEQEVARGVAAAAARAAAKDAGGNGSSNGESR